MQINDFVFYSALAGAFVFILVWFLSKDKGIAWIVTVLAGLIIIIFVFPDPKPAKTIGDIANNGALFIQKVLYGGAWGLGAFVASLFFK